MFSFFVGCYLYRRARKGRLRAQRTDRLRGFACEQTCARGGRTLLKHCFRFRKQCFAFGRDAGFFSFAFESCYIRSVCGWSIDANILCCAASGLLCFLRHKVSHSLLRCTLVSARVRLAGFDYNARIREQLVCYVVIAQREQVYFISPHVRQTAKRSIGMR